MVKMRQDQAVQKRPVVIKSESTGQLTHRLTAGKGMTFPALISNKPAMQRSRRTSIVDEIEHVFISANEDRTKKSKRSTSTTTSSTYYEAKRKPKTKNRRRNAS